MPVPLLLEPLENITIDTKMNRRFARRHHNACALPEFRSFLWAFGRIGAGLVFALRDLLLNFCQRISYGSRFFGHACWTSCADDVNRSMRVAYRAVSTGHNVKLPLLACGGRCIPGLIPRNWWSRGCGQRGNLLDLVRQLFFGRVEVIGALHVDP